MLWCRAVPSREAVTAMSFVLWVAGDRPPASRLPALPGPDHRRLHDRRTDRGHVLILPVLRAEGACRR